MNERIRELAEQAELPTIDGEWDYNNREILRRENSEWRVATPSEIIAVLFECEKSREKFAELIIGECMDIAKRTEKNFGSANSDVLEGGRGGAFCVYQNIKNTFGV